MARRFIQASCPALIMRRACHWDDPLMPVVDGHGVVAPGAGIHCYQTTL
jgi:hypothetical protein